MAKFRQGHLVLTSTQKIIQGNDTLVDVNGVANFNTLNINISATVKALEVNNLSTLSSLVLSSGVTISEFDSDGLLSSNSNSKVSTQKATKTYIDSKLSGTVSSGDDKSIVIYDGTNSLQSSMVYIDSTGNVTGINNLEVDSIATINTLKLNNGTSINEFSTDGTLINNSNNIVPTENAVKTYVDTEIINIVASGINERIVIYDGTNSVHSSLVSINNVGNINGINDLNVDGTATVSTSLFCNDLNILNKGKVYSDINSIIIKNKVAGNSINLIGRNSGDTIEKTIFIGNPDGANEFYYNGTKVAETTSNGISGAVWQ